MGTLDSLGVLSVDSDPSGYGFNITAGKFAQRYKLDQKEKKRADLVLELLGNDTPAQLEVKATLHFVNTILESEGKKDFSTVVKKVKLLKPQFEEKFIKKCLAELQSQKLM